MALVRSLTCAHLFLSIIISIIIINNNNNNNIIIIIIIIIITVIIIIQVEDALRDRVDKFETKVVHNDELMRIEIRDDDDYLGDSPKRSIRFDIQT